MIWIKRVFSLVLLGVLLYFFLPLLAEIQEVGNLFRRAQWVWLFVAIFIQLISYGFLTWLNALALQPFKGKISFGQLAAVLTSMAFIQIAVPSAGASGVALRVRLLRRFGYSPEDSLFSLVVETLLEIIALVTVALFGIAYLFRSRFLPADDVALLFILGVLTGLGLWYSWRLINNKDRSRQILVKLVDLWNRIGKRFRELDQETLVRRLEVFQQDLKKFRGGLVWKLFLAAYAKVLLDVATLGAGFFLFGYKIAPGTLLTAYGLILTFSGLAALPGGVGFGDASVPVIFSWFRVPAAVALAAGLTYRLIAFWLLRFLGFISWQVLENRS